MLNGMDKSLDLIEEKFSQEFKTMERKMTEASEELQAVKTAAEQKAEEDQAVVQGLEKKIRGSHKRLKTEMEAIGTKI